MLWRNLWSITVQTHKKLTSVLNGSISCLKIYYFESIISVIIWMDQKQTLVFIFIHLNCFYLCRKNNFAHGLWWIVYVYLSLTAFLHSDLNGARIFFFRWTGWENSGVCWISLGRCGSGLQLECSILCINHDVFTKSIERVIPTIQSLDMRITPKPTWINNESEQLNKLCG